jgi:hypothetical protein
VKRIQRRFRIAAANGCSALGQLMAKAFVTQHFLPVFGQRGQLTGIVHRLHAGTKRRSHPPDICRSEVIR